MVELGSGGNELSQRGRARGRGQQCHGEEGKLCSRNKNFPFLSGSVLESGKLSQRGRARGRGQKCQGEEGKLCLEIKLSIC